MPIEIVLSNALENHVADCPNTASLDSRVTALEQGGGGSGLPKMVSESLNEQDDSTLVARFAFDGDTTSILTASANLGAVFTGLYSEGMTTYTGTVAKSAMVGGARLVVMFTMGSGDDIKLIWQKNYSIVDFGVIPPIPSGEETDPIYTADKQGTMQLGDVEVAGSLTLGGPPLSAAEATNKAYVDSAIGSVEQNILDVTDALGGRIDSDEVAITALSASGAKLSDDLTKHRSTDIFRWNDVYDTQYDLFVSVARAAGLKPDSVGVALTAGETYNTSDISDVGGLLKLTAQNVDGTYLWVDIDGGERYSTYELAEGVQVVKYMRLNVGQTIIYGGPGTVQFYKWIADDESQIRLALDKMQDEIAANKILILDIQAGIQNKKPSGVKQDINNQTFTITNELGGRLTGKGLNLLLGSTGVVTVTNAQGATEVYNNVGLLSLLDSVPVLVKDVAQGDIVTSTGMGELFYEDYVAG